MCHTVYKHYLHTYVHQVNCKLLLQLMQDQLILDVMGFFVVMALGVYHSILYVMDIHHAVMDLMKKTVVRFKNILTLKITNDCI